MEIFFLFHTSDFCYIFALMKCISGVYSKMYGHTHISSHKANLMYHHTMPIVCIRTLFLFLSLAVSHFSLFLVHMCAFCAYKHPHTQFENAYTCIHAKHTQKNACAHVHARTHTYNYTHINTHAHTRTHTYKHTRAPTHTHKHTFSLSRTHAHADTRVHTHTQTHTHTHIHTYTHTHIHTYTHTHIHTHT